MKLRVDCAPGGMKSALMAQAAICVAEGSTGTGKAAKESGAVIYFAIERADLVGAGWLPTLQKLGLPKKLLIAVVDATLDLRPADAFKKVLRYHSRG